MPPVMLERKRLGRHLTLALDLARACAAVYVVLHHLATAYGFAGGPGIILRFGQEAVIVFFVLSGFVIFANEHERALHIRGYFFRRARRIYPPLLVALLLSTVIAASDERLRAAFSLHELAATLLGLQDIAILKPGVISDPYLGNAPLWSLSYEIAFYIAFPAVLWMWKRWPEGTTHGVGLVCCIAYAAFAIKPNHWFLVTSYFMVWWCGAMAAHSYLSGRNDLGGMRATFLWHLALCAIATVVMAAVGFRGVGVYPALTVRHFAAAAVLLVVFYGPAGRFVAGLLGPIRQIIVFVAAISYGLYVFHFPLLIQWRFSQTPLGFIIAILLLISLSYAADYRLGHVLRRSRPVRGESLTT